MKKMKHYKMALLLSVLLLIISGVQAQQGSLKLNLTYAAGIPTGSFSNVTDKVSPRGWEAAVLYGVNDRLSVGLVTGFQDFYQKYNRQLIHASGSDLSAVISNSVQTTPFMAKVKYNLAAATVVQPYAAVAAGANFVNYKTYYGEFSDSYSKIKFGAQPELGITIPVGSRKRTAINLAAGYNIIPFHYTGFQQVDALNNIVVKGGINIPIR